MKSTRPVGYVYDPSMAEPRSWSIRASDCAIILRCGCGNLIAPDRIVVDDSGTTRKPPECALCGERRQITLLDWLPSKSAKKGGA